VRQVKDKVEVDPENRDDAYSKEFPADEKMKKLDELLEKTPVSRFCREPTPEPAVPARDESES
jgi:hypothetical protein